MILLKKRITALFVAFLMLFGTTPFAYASAADELSIIGGKEELMVGERATFEASIGSVAGAVYKWTVKNDALKIVGPDNEPNVKIEGFKADLGITKLDSMVESGITLKVILGDDSEETANADVGVYRPDLPESAGAVTAANGNIARASGVVLEAERFIRPTSNLNNGTLGSSNGNTSWNTIGYGADYPTRVQATLADYYVVSSMRIMWWAGKDNAWWMSSDDPENYVNVAFPASAGVEYYNGTEWVAISAMVNEEGASTDQMGVKYATASGDTSLSACIGAGNRYWNVVSFNEPVRTNQIRLVVDNNETGRTGVGASEWEVFGTVCSNDELMGVKVSGEAVVTLGDMETYTATPSADLPGTTYSWSIPGESSDYIGITSANNNQITIKGLKVGYAELAVAATHGDSTKTAVFEVYISGVESIENYETETAAGTAPILPKRVVANGLRFDKPTAKAVGEYGYDFSETFDSKLVPVLWDMVNPADYAADKEGTSFEVNGVVDYEGVKYPAKAIIKVNQPLEAPDFNRSITSENVRFNDVFWSPKQLVNAYESFDRAIYWLEFDGTNGGTIPNFLNAIRRLSGEAATVSFRGQVFQDSDLYKTIEAFAYNLAALEDDHSAETEQRKLSLQAKLDEWIGYIETVQYADGYINTAFSTRSTNAGAAGGTGMTSEWRWRNFHRHEMYNIGHLLEAVVAYTRYREGVGRPDYKLYEIGKRAANSIVDLFGPSGKRHEVPGHQEIELALMKMANLVEEYEGVGTGQKYRDTAKLLIDRRGHIEGRESGLHGGAFGPYGQDYTPFVDEVNVVGHAVRAMYFYTGITDVSTTLPGESTDREKYLNILQSLQGRAVERNTYITGGIGSNQPGASSEGFGEDYALSNTQSYCEICAAIASANWNQRMNLAFEDAKYVDAYERALYNGVLVGVNLSGGLFYYSTTLENGGNTRSTWFGTACCPPNLMRTIANMGGYLYAVNKDKVYINMYGGSESHVNVEGTNVKIDQETNYPWEGIVKITVTPGIDKNFTVNIRIPGWIKSQKYQEVTLKVDGVSIDATPNDKGYVAINRNWPATGTVVDIEMPMEVRFTEPDNNVHNIGTGSHSNRNRVAIERGPIVYNLETPGLYGTENTNARNVRIPRNMELTPEWNPDLLRGVVELKGTALYGTNDDELTEQPVQITPYYSRNNRGNDSANLGSEGALNNTNSMIVWMYATEQTVQIRGQKNTLKMGETTGYTAVPKVNLSDLPPASYEWKTTGGIDLVGVPASGKTDDRGPGKMYGEGFQLDTSCITIKATALGPAELMVTSKDSAGKIIATDTYLIQVTDLDLESAAITGPATLTVNDSGSYAVSITPAGLTGVTYEWSISDGGDKAEITSSANSSDVTVKAVGVGIAKLSVVVKQGSLTKTAEFIINVAAIKNTVTVNSEGTGSTGSGEYEEGATVTIYAGTAPAGQQFVNWTVISGGAILDNANSAITTFTMPANAVAVRANFEDVEITATTYAVTVNSIGSGATGSDDYEEGATVTIYAGAAPASQRFTNWTVESGGVTLANANSATTTFIMPANAVTVRANFETSSTSSNTSNTGGVGVIPSNTAPETQPGESVITEPGTPLSGETWFQDVNTGDWFYNNVRYVNQNNLMNGTSTAPMLFGPNNPLTRGMIVTILYRHAGSPSISGTNPFSDVPGGQWYTNAVIWAAEKGIVEGFGGGIYEPNANITREQLAAILYRYAQFLGNIPEGSLTGGLTFTDSASISDYAKDAALFCSNNGIISGKPVNLFDPRGEATRAEAAAMLNRFIESLMFEDLQTQDTTSSQADQDDTEQPEGDADNTED